MPNEVSRRGMPGERNTARCWTCPGQVCAVSSERVRGTDPHE